MIRSERTGVRSAALFACLGLVVAATLVPASGARLAHEWCLVCGGHATSDFLLNVLLFLPLGVALRWSLSSRPLRLWLLATALSAGIELVQLAMPGRLTSAADVVANSAGAGLGVWLAARPWGRIRSNPHMAGRVAAIAGLFAACVMLVTDEALRPSLLPSTWYGQWTPELGHLDTYEGRVLDVHIADVAVPGHRLEDGGAAVRARLLAGFPLTVRFIVGPGPRHLAPVFSVFDRSQQEMLLVGAEGNRLVVRVRRRAADLRLQQPELRMPLDASPGDTATVGVVLRPHQLVVRVDGRVRRDALAAPGRGWSLLFRTPASPLADAAWLAFLWFPIGFWWRRTATAVLGAAAAAGILVASVACPYATLTLTGVLGALAGGLGGRLVSVATRGDRSRARP